MDELELATARTELAQLEDKLQELFGQLIDVHAAVSAQKTKIDQLIRRRTSSVQRLPAELFLLILDFDVWESDSPSRMQELASVCRHWRDTILNSPSLWSIVKVTPSVESSLMETHLRRSCDMPLVVMVTSDGPGLDQVGLCLDTLMSSAHRWRFLRVTMKSGTRSPDLVKFITDRMSGLEFPLLKHVTILSGISAMNANFLSLTRTPSIQHLELAELYQWEKLPAFTSLQTLKLDLYYDVGPAVPFADLFSIGTLTTLSLRGEIINFTFGPNSIHLPLLRSLTLDVIGSKLFLELLAAPRLERFEYTSHEGDGPPSSIFNRLEGKFASVTHFCLPQKAYLGTMSHTFDTDSAMAICKAFPCVTHAELNANDMHSFFAIGRCTVCDFSFDGCPVDFWIGLKFLDLPLGGAEWPEGLYHFAHWLLMRAEQGLYFPHVRFRASPRNDMLKFSISSILILYDVLKYSCILEIEALEIAPGIVISLPERCSLMLVGEMEL